MRKEIIILCSLEVGGERRRVFDPKGISGSLSATDYKDPPKIIKCIDKRYGRNDNP